jgi:hypothetical protein
MFTTRKFSTGAPFALAGTPVVSAYEDAGTTQITAGITLGVDHDTVTGLNLVTVVASGANGFEAGKDYHLVITTGTVDSVSVVGEVVGRFTLSRSAAAVDLANATDGLGAIKTETASIQTDTNDIQTRLPAALVSGRIDASVGAMATDTITSTALAASAVTEIQSGLATSAALTTVEGKIDIIDTNVDAVLDDTGTSGVVVASIAANAVSAAALATDAVTEIQSGLATAASLTTVEGKIDIIDTNVDSVLDDTGTAGVVVASIAANAVNASALAADAVTEIQSGLATAAALDAVDNFVDTEVSAIKAVTDKLDTALELDVAVYRFTTNALEQAPTGGSAPTASQIADEVQTRTIAAVTTVNGLAANTVTASALAADAVTEIADGILNRDMSSGTDSGSDTVRTPRQALRFLRNKWAVAAGTLTVYKEDDSTSSWTSAVTGDATADPVIGSDPTGP